MAYPAYIREKARWMRVERRLTIDQIAERLAVSRTTVYYWIRDLPAPVEVTHSGRRQAARRKATRAMQRTYRLRQEAAYREGLATFETLSADVTFRDFVCLYLAEGYKRNRNRVAIGNSDPAVVLLATRWIRRLTTKPIRFSIQYHADQDLTELCRFWSEVLDLEAAAIRLQRKSNSNQLHGRVWRSRHGVLSVVVGDTLPRARLEAWMDELRGSWG